MLLYVSACDYKFYNDTHTSYMDGDCLCARVFVFLNSMVIYNIRCGNFYVPLWHDSL